MDRSLRGVLFLVFKGELLLFLMIELLDVGIKALESLLGAGPKLSAVVKQKVCLELREISVVL